MDQMEKDIFYIEVRTLEKAMELVAEGFKLGGELAKQAIVYAIDKAEIRKADKGGLTSLKSLLKSKDAISSFAVKDSLREKLIDRFNDLGIKFSCLDNKELKESRFFVEDGKLPLVKAAMEDIVKAEELRSKSSAAANRFYKELSEDNFDLRDIATEEVVYRYSVNSIDKDTTKTLKEELAKNDIKSEVIVTDINNDDSLNVEFKVNKEDREKCIEIINNYIAKFTRINNSVKEEKKGNEKEKGLGKIINMAKVAAESINVKNKHESQKEIVGRER